MFAELKKAVPYETEILPEKVFRTRPRRAAEGGGMGVIRDVKGVSLRGVRDHCEASAD